MADEETPLLRPCDGGPGGAAESAEPAPKRQRLDSEDGGCGRGAAPAQRPERGSGPPPPAAAVAAELPGEAAAVTADGGGRAAAQEEEEEDEEAAAAAVWSGADNRAGLRGLPRAEPQPRQRGRGEGAEAAPGEEAAEAAAIGCGRAQRSNGAAEAPAPHPDNFLFSDEIIANGFHSCDSDEDDRASHASSSDWTPRPRIGPYTFVQQHLMLGTDPRTILKDLLPETIPPPELDDMTLWQIVINILSEPPKRKKRKDINTIDDAVKLLQECKKIMVLTGAGVSVSCGIPDFRSRDGIYARLAVDFPDLPDPQAMFDIEYFRKDPRPFFKFAKEIYPGQFQPSLCHKFIALMDKEGKLLRNYTQNIDTLEQVAGIQRIIQCHGSFATASCLICKYKVDCEVVRGDIFNQVVPRCPRCPPDEPLAIMKPDIVFFGENLPEQFHRAMKYDKNEVDLLIVIGSSLKVRPVALIPSSIPHEVPQILINREPLPHLHFDVELLGDCDVIINELCQRLGSEYTKLCYNSVKLSEITEKPPRTHKELEMHSSELPPTPLNISEGSSSPERMTPPDTSVVSSEHPAECKVENCDPASETKGTCAEEKLQDTQTSSENPENPTSELMNSETMKENGSNNGENKEKNEILRKCWVNRSAKEQISKRLDGTQYLFLPPNRYIFHGAEVYSDSEDDIISSSSCGSSSSESGSCRSQSLDVEDESEIEEFYNGIEDEDAPEREEEPGFGEDGVEQDESAADESAYTNEAAGTDHPSNKL
ncbi:NAD-dependent protein deacetylase sirtuin-1 isoform X1 [Aquila chrysaetos chrysaetos]|uniref:protein acetyllysine N-acetyltransferase n=2 Tax=Aquila chrysaetos chrysaetos TaxID=223781 RepID=A0A663DWM8_AQUCH|nr:NAD-dependent protein deacetylase sirtuin-1 isoform X1 [Aquila chrysaetos chrysaetos]